VNDAFASSTKLTILNNGNIGIGTSSPYANLSVVGAGGVVADVFNATSTVATSTFAGGLNVGSGNLVYENGSGITYANALQTGNFNFDTNAGAVSWVDLLTDSNAATGTVQSYTASLNGSSTITVYGLSDGNGNLQPDWPRVAIGSTTAPTSKLTVFSNGTGSNGTFEALNDNGKSLFKILDNGNIGIGTTTPSRHLTISNSDTLSQIMLEDTTAAAGFHDIGIKSYQGDFSINSMTDAGVATTRFMIASTTGNVGIGTASPSAILDVNGQSIYRDAMTFANQGRISWINSAPNRFTIKGLASYGISFGANGVDDYLIINTSGNVGIGTTSPYAKLSVAGSVVADSFNATSTTATSTFAGDFVVNGTADLASSIIGPMSFSTDAGALTDAGNSWMNLPLSTGSGAQSYSAQIAGTNILTIYGNGNGSGGFTSYGVGVGTTSPWAQLSVDSTGVTTFPAFVVGSSTATSFLVDNNGNVGIGSTSPSAKLAVSGNIFVGGAGTSTIQNNLNVLGTVHGGVVYAGDLFFANRWSFTEAPLDIAPQGLLLKNQNGSSTMTVDDSGNVTIAGDICANGRNCFGKSLNDLSATVSAMASSTALSLSSAQATTSQSFSELTVSMGSINQALIALTTRVGGLEATFGDVGHPQNGSSTVMDSVLNSLTEQIAASTTVMDSLAKSMTNSPAAMDSLTAGVANKIMASSTAISDIASSTAGVLLTSADVQHPQDAASTTVADVQHPQTFIARVANAVMDYIKSVANWVFSKITAVLGVFNRVETQTAAVTQGLEMTDQATGQVYCVMIKNGDWSKVAGKCADVQLPQTVDVGHPPATTTQTLIVSNNPTPLLQSSAGQVNNQSDATTSVSVSDIATTATSTVGDVTHPNLVTPAQASATSSPVIAPTQTEVSPPSGEVTPPVTPAAASAPAAAAASVETPAPAPTPANPVVSAGDGGGAVTQ